MANIENKLTISDGIVEIVLDIEPVPCPRPRFAGFGVYYPKDYTDFKNDLEDKLSNLFLECIQDGAIHLELEFYFRITKTNKGKFKSGDYVTKKPDSDNLAKSIMDAMNTICFKDDGQVASLLVKKIYTDLDSYFIIRYKKI